MGEEGAADGGEVEKEFAGFTGREDETEGGL